MSEKLTNLQQLRSASLEAKGLIAQVASAAAEAVEELDSSKQGQLQRITDEEIDAMWA